MILFESPKAAAFDGTLATWAVFAATHFAAGLIWLLTISLLIVRLMILVRQWRRG